MSSKHEGDPPHQHLLPIIPRLSPSPAVLRKILRQLGIPDPEITADLLFKSGLSLAPQETPRKVLLPQKIVQQTPPADIQAPPV
jgi:hypothetical protein